MNFNSMDITKKKKKETGKTHDSSLQKELDQLAASITHEINTPIQYMSDNINFIQDSFKELLRFSKDCCDFIEKVKKGLIVPESINPSLWKKSYKHSFLGYIFGTTKFFVCNISRLLIAFSKIVKVVPYELFKTVNIWNNRNLK